MPTKTKVLIAGAVLALGAAVPAIAQAGGESATATPGDGTQVDVQSNQDVVVVGSDDEAGAEDEVGAEVEDGAEVAVGSDDESETDDEAGEAEEASAGDSEAPIPATDIDRASAAALAYLGNGRVTATEVGDEESYYEVEVTRDDGSQVDVQLDENFNVVSTEDDGSDG